MSKEFCGEMAKSYCWVHLAFVERHATAFSQPPDIPYMKPVNAVVRKEASSVVATPVLGLILMMMIMMMIMIMMMMIVMMMIIIGLIDDEGFVTSAAVLRLNPVGIVQGALAALSSKGSAGWMRLLVDDETRAKLAAEAWVLLQQGQLWTYVHKADVQKPEARDEFNVLESDGETGMLIDPELDEEAKLEMPAVLDDDPPMAAPETPTDDPPLPAPLNQEPERLEPATLSKFMALRLVYGRGL